MTHVKFITPSQKSFNNFFDDFMNGMPSLKGNSSNPSITRQVVPANISETATEYVLQLIAPGFEKEDFQVNMDQHIITISAETKKSRENNDVRKIREEYKFSSFQRSFTIDKSIDADHISASYVNGILQLNFSKKVEVKEAVKKISVI